MSIKLIYHGPLWQGSTSLQRLRAFGQIRGVTAIGHDTGARFAKSRNILNRVRWKLGWPSDMFEENRRLLEIAAVEHPDIVMVDNSRVITRQTLVALRNLGVGKLVYYTPDDIVAPHNLTFQLRHSLANWDIFFTTKTYNIPELHALGVRRPRLIGKAFDPELHMPMNAAEIGTEYEKFDAVFVGSYEKERCASINALAATGFSVVIYGLGNGGWRRGYLHPAIELRESRYAREYVAAWHTGKVSLCFLRKIHRDRITQRSIELAAIGRPMVGEKTDEHDAHFTDGTEYFGFTTDEELVNGVRLLVADPERRRAMGRAARLRCLKSGYSSFDRAQQMVSVMLEG